MESERYKIGWEKLKEVDGSAGEAVVESLNEIAPDLGKYIIEYGFGDVYSRPGTSLKQKEVAVVAALTAMGNAAPQLKVHINGAINVGCSIEELVEIMIQMSVYCGFPAAINGITVLKEVIKERDIKFNPVSQNSGENRFKTGKKWLEKLEEGHIQELKEKLDPIAPDMVNYIIEHAYGSVYNRKSLEANFRQIATISALTVKGTDAPQLRFHIKAGLSTDLTKDEIIETIILMSVYAGFPAAINGLNIAKDVFKEL
ncbi:MAG: carboxymuconolactone decarboxylase [Methanobacteriales archaeon HGW-Methanobacteriales-1]|jgi:4-carboxymuconolactone decarboxylase|nr:MAG: carboxymuconolactone decarboxylase [Methanobacteriales archaeon HGW-Methanobacteriales-1]